MLKDLVGEEETKVEFSVMVLGGAAAVKRADEEVIPPVATAVSGSEVLGSDAFWGELRGFLVQKSRNEGQAERAFAVFKKAWEQQK